MVGISKEKLKDILFNTIFGEKIKNISSFLSNDEQYKELQIHLDENKLRKAYIGHESLLRYSYGRVVEIRNEELLFHLHKKSSNKRFPNNIVKSREIDKKNISDYHSYLEAVNHIVDFIRKISYFDRASSFLLDYHSHAAVFDNIMLIAPLDNSNLPEIIMNSDGDLYATISETNTRPERLISKNSFPEVYKVLEHLLV